MKFFWFFDFVQCGEYFFDTVNELEEIHAFLQHGQVIQKFLPLSRRSEDEALLLSLDPDGSQSSDESGSALSNLSVLSPELG